MSDQSRKPTIREEAVRCLFSAIETEIAGVHNGHVELANSNIAVAQIMTQIMKGWRDDETYRYESLADPDPAAGRGFTFNPKIVDVSGLIEAFARCGITLEAERLPPDGEIQALRVLNRQTGRRAGYLGIEPLGSLIDRLDGPDPNNPDGRYDEDMKRWGRKVSPLDDLNLEFSKWGVKISDGKPQFGLAYAVEFGPVLMTARDHPELRRILKAFRLGVGLPDGLREVQDPAPRPKDEIGIARDQPRQSGVEALRKMLEDYPLTGDRNQQRVRRALDAVLQCQHKVMNPPETDSTRNIYVMFWRMHLQVALDATIHALGSRCPCWLAQVACFEGDQADLLEQSLEAMMKIDMDFWVDLPRHRADYQAQQARINEWWKRQVEAVSSIPTPPPPGAGKVAYEDLPPFCWTVEDIKPGRRYIDQDGDSMIFRLPILAKPEGTGWTTAHFQRGFVFSFTTKEELADRLNGAGARPLDHEQARFRVRRRVPWVDMWKEAAGEAEELVTLTPQGWEKALGDRVSALEKRVLEIEQQPANGNYSTQIDALQRAVDELRNDLNDI